MAALCSCVSRVMDDVDVEALSVCALEWMADTGHLGWLREQCERHQQEGNDVGTLTSSSHWRSMNKIKIKAAAARFGSYPLFPVLECFSFL